MALAASPSARTPPTPVASPERDRQTLRWNFQFPLYLRNNLDTYIQDHPGVSLATVVLAGFKALGIEIDEADLRPRRAARGPRKRTLKPDDDADTVKVSSFHLPRYARAGAEEYIRQHPGMGLRNVAMAGFQALGIPVRDVDLTTQKPDILTHGNQPRTLPHHSPAQAPARPSAKPAAQRRSA